MSTDPTPYTLEEALALPVGASGRRVTAHADEEPELYARLRALRATWPMTYNSPGIGGLYHLRAYEGRGRWSGWLLQVYSGPVLRSATLSEVA